MSDLQAKCIAVAYLIYEQSVGEYDRKPKYLNQWKRHSAKMMEIEVTFSKTVDGTISSSVIGDF